MGTTTTVDEKPVSGIVRQHINEHYDVIETVYGKLLINAHDPLLPYNVSDTPIEIADLCQYAKGVVIDVGANIGTHSINFCRTAEIVYAIEPQPLTYYNLCANLLLNLCYNVLPCNYALGSYNGTIQVPNLDPTVPNTAMGVRVGEGIGTIPIRTLDSLGIARVDFIKIDVEGYELEVLRGAVDTLTLNDVIVYVEIHRDELIAPIKDLMHNLGYKSEEYLTQYTREDGTPFLPGTYIGAQPKEQYPDVDGIIVLTAGYLFWRGGRIVWV